MSSRQSPRAIRLRNARKGAGFTSSRAAALRYRWPPSTLAAHENGTRDFDEDTAEKYGKAFNVDPLWLLHGVGEPKPATVDEHLQRVLSRLSDARKTALLNHLLAEEADRQK